MDMRECSRVNMHPTLPHGEESNTNNTSGTGKRRQLSTLLCQQMKSVRAASSSLVCPLVRLSRFLFSQRDGSEVLRLARVWLFGEQRKLWESSTEEAKLGHAGGQRQQQICTHNGQCRAEAQQRPAGDDHPEVRRQGERLLGRLARDATSVASAVDA